MKRMMRRLTSAYLSVVSHNDQLHILGCSLGMAFMLQEINESGQATVGWKAEKDERWRNRRYESKKRK